MTPGALISSVIDFFQSDPIIAIGISIVVALLFYFKTKPMLQLLAVLLCFWVAFYIFSLLGDTASMGIVNKEGAIQ